MSGTILVCGFRPFAGLADNPATLLLPAVEGLAFRGLRVRSEATDVDVATIADSIRTLIARHRPDAFVGLGLAAGEPVLRCETTAINRLDLGTPDNRGRRPADGRPIDPDGPAARFATWDAAGLARAVRATGLPARVSHFAGTHLCNAMLYTAVGAMQAEGLAGPTGFLHLPYLPGQIARFLDDAPPEGDAAPFTPRAIASMSLADQSAGLTALLARLAADAAP